MKVTLDFHMKPPSKSNTGLKLVIWEVLIPPATPEAEPTIKHDWGFAEWSGKKWEDLPGLPEGYFAVVVRWTETIDPVIILNPSKIITLN